MIQHTRTSNQSGAVSLFVVIFAMLLLTIITMSFVRLMISDQQRASNVDLSQSAFDSAQAGAEDAKRALIWYQKRCQVSEAACELAKTAITSPNCNTGLRASGVISGLATDKSEVLVQQNTSTVDKDLDQAYTCVKMEVDTDNIEATIPKGGSRLIALRGVSQFDQVRLSWFSSEDLTIPTDPVDVSMESPDKPLFSIADWSANRPPIMRAQMMQVGKTFTLSDFDRTVGAAGNQSSNSNALFLYPVRANSGNTFASFVDRDVRKASNDPNEVPLPDSKSDTPLATRCQPTVTSGNFSCSIVLHLPFPINGDKNDRTAFLRLATYYNGAKVRVELLDSAMPGVVNFKGVQPRIDSTGRANDMFRRIETRVELTDPTFPYPDAAVDISGNFCKDFSVTDSASIAGACTN